MAVTIFLSFPAYSQVVVDDSLRVKLDEIRVEAAHSSITIGEAALSVSYLTRDAMEISGRPAATMDELTFSMPGIFVSNRENYALGERLTIRGLGWRSQFGVRGAQVILDDIPLTVADGQTIMNMIDPAMVQRMELLRGPSATFWGNSSGGVLYLSTKPRPDSPALQLRGYAGSYNTFKQEVRWNASSSTAGNRFYGYASYFDTNGFRDHSAARLFRASAGYELPVGADGRLNLIATYAGMPKAQHPGALTDQDSKNSPRDATQNFVDNAAGKNFDQAMLSASYTQNHYTGILNVTAHGTYRDLENPLPFGFVGLERLAGGVRSTYNFADLPFDLSLGGEIKIQRDDRLETDNINGQRGDQVSVSQIETVSNQAFFARTAIPINQKFSINAGARADWLQFEADDGLDIEQDGSRSFFSVNPSAGFVLKLNQARIFANFSTSFESPTTTELVNRPEGGNGFNQNVDPEKTVSFETGIQGEDPGIGISYDVTIFTMRVDDLLIPFQLETDGPSFFRNEGKTRHYGLESSLGVYLSGSLDARIMLNFLRAQFDGGEFDGNDVPGVAPFRFGSMVNFRPGSHQFSIDTEWLGSYQANSQNSVKNSPYALFHARWTMELPGIFEQGTLRPFLAVNNILNTRYNSSVAINAFGGRFFEPGSDRNFRIGLQIDLF